MMSLVARIAGVIVLASAVLSPRGGRGGAGRGAEGVAGGVSAEVAGFAFVESLGNAAFHVDGPITSISAQGGTNRILVCSDRSLSLLDLTTGVRLARVECAAGQLLSAVLLPEGRRCVYLSSNDPAGETRSGRWTLLNMETGREAMTVDHPTWLSQPHLAGGSRQFVARDGSGAVVAWDLADGKEIHRWPARGRSAAAPMAGRSPYSGETAPFRSGAALLGR
jgi:hypothetical protein